MAIQFPNFLQVPVRTPDYSSIGDVFQNYYAGKAMPRDDLIKAIQAQFARPNAEQSLLSTKLSNRKSQLEIDKMAQDMADQAAFEKKLRQALGGNQAPVNTPIGTSGQNPLPLPPVRNALPIGASPMQTSRVAAMPGVNIAGDNAGADAGFDPTMMDARFRKFDQMATGLPKNAYTPIPSAANAQAAPIAPAAPITAPVTPRPSEPQSNEAVIAKGEPHLAGIDQLWESDPSLRPYLEKKGYKKTQEVKFDNKTGRTTILTKYPSGMITLQTSGGTSAGEAPLTNANITKNQGIVAAIDNTIPVIKDILALDKSTPKNSQWEPYPRSSGWEPGLGWLPGYSSASTNYEALVSSALDTLLGAYGLPKTNEGIETVKKQLLIGHGETDSAYKKRLQRLMEDLQRRRSYSEGLVNKSNKKSPIDTSAGASSNGEDTYSSNEWEAV